MTYNMSWSICFTNNGAQLDPKDTENIENTLNKHKEQSKQQERIAEYTRKWMELTEK